MKSKPLHLPVLILAAIALAANGCHDNPARPESPGARCGTIAGLGCPAGQTCELPAGECQTADLAGICVISPEACTMQYDPVCGCDGVTYGNDCLRLMAGVQRSHEGECS